MTSHQPILVGINEACRLLGGIGRTNLYALLSSGQLESVKLGKRRLVRVASLHALISAAETGKLS